MIDGNQIRKWIKEGIINDKEGKKIIDSERVSDSDIERDKRKNLTSDKTYNKKDRDNIKPSFNRKKNRDKKGNNKKKIYNENNKDIKSKPNYGITFFLILEIIGIIFIILGVSWVLTQNWNKIPKILRAILLVFFTIGFYFLGVVLKKKFNKVIGEALIVFGDLIFVLSLFLINNLFQITDSAQGYAWILLISFVSIGTMAYFFESKISIAISLMILYYWVILQFSLQFSFYIYPYSATALLILSLFYGVFLFAMTGLHLYLKHQFLRTYRFLMMLFFALFLFEITLQSFITQLSIDKSNLLSPFLLGFIIGVSTFLGIVAYLFLRTKRDYISKRTIKRELLFLVGFVGLLLLLTILLKGYNLRENSTFRPGECNVRINKFSCDHFQTKQICNAFHPEMKINCSWDSYYNRCEANTSQDSNKIYRSTLKKCKSYNYNKQECERDSDCDWMSHNDYYGYNGTNVFDGQPLFVKLVWLIINALYILFISVMIWYGIRTKQGVIIDFALFFLVAKIIALYVNFWSSYSEKLTFSVSVIIGGVILIVLAWFSNNVIKKSRKREFLEKDEKEII
ncbi:MAG: DUF2157 domain-containing protein [Nitrospiraceae bacterium]|nr:DUF2157 domain-containing protein [Nitrospiraceae bacterium]